MRSVPPQTAAWIRAIALPWGQCGEVDPQAEARTFFAGLLEAVREVEA